MPPFPKPKAETWRSRLWRWGFNLFPAYWGTGGRVVYIAPDWREVHVALPLNWRTRNYVGTLFGGSMYGAIDPVYMLMLIHNLGPDYVVWDKAATIRFRRPGRTTLYARFILTEEELQTIRRLACEQSSLDRVYPVELVDRLGVVYASFEKTLYVRKAKKE
ncbi:MAG: DUF4442 domain-containing protein [Meiothermus sp.]|uniref:DUF4442 domain-containing protein n=1 Tax=Meiothermus sp. TaxID=1955249 RepID=UPI0025F1270C|nr:DUF4442 domain-containing protein [Meiothermus sp.]MCS7058702.1 DUF4442 domain-containing protein [Meiothermus sp.]MCS7195231.1 DUF4442 domain-containing protein [Meiothermus sp.]MCX7739424.1 DUF4442 domain-containing protein [Meiothermus sp.]MDW8089971.1 DUF4442 domain-containing protein [Meiothermus sp.]MDW8480623.1 DUF4442 domain-containing protein [Meiothermus sp.]